MMYNLFRFALFRKHHMQFVIFYYRAYFPLNWIHLLQQTCDTSRPFKFLSCCANQVSTGSITASLETKSTTF